MPPTRTIALAALLFAVAAAPLHAETYHVYCLGGQSNMDGYGFNKDLPPELAKPIDGVYIFHGNTAKDGEPVDGRGVWATLRPGHGVNFKSDGKANQYSDRFGVELTFAQRIRRLHPDRNIAIIKYSRGGTSISLNSSAADMFGTWDPDFNKGGGAGAGVNQYDHFLATIRHATAVRDIDGDGTDDTLVPAGILWMQGESDSIELPVAEAYGANLKRLMDLLRAALREDDLPIAIGRISDSQRDGKPIWVHGAVIRAHMAAFCATDAAAALVTGTDAYAYSDPWHYNSAGYIDLGRRFADALRSIDARTAPPPKQVLYLTTTEGKKLIVYDIDAASGALTSKQELELAGPGGPVAVSDDRTRLYAAVRGNPQRVQLFSIDRATGKLTPGATADLTGNPTYLDVDATGRWLLAAYYGEGMATAHRIGDDGAVVAGPAQTIALEKNAHALLLDPLNRIGYVPATGPNRIWQFRFNAAVDEPLVKNKSFEVVAGESARGKQGPRHYAWHPMLDRVYAVNELDSSVTVYALDAFHGTLTHVQSLPTLPADFTGTNTCADIHVTPNGRYVYASNRGHNSLAGYRIDPFTGEMTPIGTFETEDTPREFEIDATGRFLYAAGLKSSKLACYRIDGSTGKLEKFATLDTPAGPIWVTAMKLD